MEWPAAARGLSAGMTLIAQTRRTGALVEPLEGRALMSATLTADAAAPAQVADGTSTTILVAERTPSSAAYSKTLTFTLSTSTP